MHSGPSPQELLSLKQKVTGAVFCKQCEKQQHKKLKLKVKNLNYKITMTDKTQSPLPLIQSVKHLFGCFFYFKIFYYS